MKKTEMLNELNNMDNKALVKELNAATSEISKTKTAFTFGKEKNTKKIFELKKKKSKNLDNFNPKDDFWSRK